MGGIDSDEMSLEKETEGAEVVVVVAVMVLLLLLAASVGEEAEIFWARMVFVRSGDGCRSTSLSLGLAA